MLRWSIAVDTSRPFTRRMPTRSAASCASSHPTVVSWSVSATTSSPAFFAFSTSSVGVSVPSERLEWVWRSMFT